jgi:predicted anti-sigma-YlaC factor YlaD
MRNEHILELLDSTPLRSMSEADLARIREHSEQCALCRQAFKSAQVSSLLLRERATTAIEPSPFFKTKVMAAIRERQAAAGAFSFLRFWRAARSLVYSMAAIVVLLTGLTISQPGLLMESGSPDQIAGISADDPEWAFLATDSASSEEMTYDQVLTDIYSASERGETDGDRK